MRAFPFLILFPLLVAFGVGAHEGHGVKAKSGLAVGAALSPQGQLWVVGLEEGRLVTWISGDAGATWGPARVLSIGDDTVAADGESHPKIAFGPHGGVVIAYTKPLARPYTGEIRMLRSDDGGDSFSAPFTVHRDRQLITHRFESIAFDRDGVLHTVWVDKRDQIGKSGYRGAAIYRNESRDGGRTFGPDIRLAEHSCECCRIALTAAPEGGIAALWRHVFSPNQRDHAFALLGRGDVSLGRATYDGWAIDACPHHGPGIAAAAGGGYHIVWFGERAGKPAVRYGRLSASGEPRGEVLELPDAAAEHADVAAAGHFVTIVWRSFDTGRTRLRAWLSSDDGAHFRLVELDSIGEENDQPRLAADGTQIVALWRTARGLRAFRLRP